MAGLAAILLASAPAIADEAPSPPARTQVDDAGAMSRLLHNSGVTLHWIGFETPRRGKLTVRTVDGVMHLAGAHQSADGRQHLTIDGDVVRIGARDFTFRGRIVIDGSPDPRRRCVRDGPFDFRITGKRRYWRLQQMEMCDGLTDYVDIYF